MILDPVTLALVALIAFGLGLLLGLLLGLEARDDWGRR